MAIKPRRANSPILDSEGFTTGTLTAVTLIESEDSDFNREQFQLDFKSEGTTKPINFKIWVGTTISKEKFTYSTGEIDYSKLTLLCLNLGLITLKDLDSDEEINIDLESLIGKNFKFKLSRNKNGLSNINVSSIKLTK